MASQLDGECLLAAIGLHNVLRGKASLHKYQVLRAAEMPREIRKRMLRFLATDDVEKASDVPDFDFDELKDLLPKGQTTEQMAALNRAVPDPDLAQEMATELGSAQQWLNSVMPRETRETIMGPRDETPSDSDLADFARFWQVACDPMSILQDLAECCLTNDQVLAAVKCWPSLYQEMRTACAEGIVTMVGRRKTWEPSSLKAAQIGVLRMVDGFDAELAGIVQQSYAAEAAQQPPPPKQTGGNGPDDASLTPGQKASGG